MEQRGRLLLAWSPDGAAIAFTSYRSATRTRTSSRSAPMVPARRCSHAPTRTTSGDGVVTRRTPDRVHERPRDRRRHLRDEREVEPASGTSPPPRTPTRAIPNGRPSARSSSAVTGRSERTSRWRRPRGPDGGRSPRAPAGTPTRPGRPNGTRIAFSSDRDGDAEIFVVGSNGSGLLKLTQNRI